MPYITRKPLREPLPKLTEIEEKTMNLWLSLGTIWVTDVGQENVYFIDEFDNEFYCKCYPQ
jgi:uncharacterized protein YaeQ